MIKANLTIFEFYLTMMEFFSEYLSRKYSNRSLGDLEYFETIIIQKIVRMFHTLVDLSRNEEDEVSLRCILRAILDNVTIFCFIYDREDKQDVLFRHYLYELDGIKSYKKFVVDELFEKEERIFYERMYDETIKLIEDRLYIHPYYNTNDKDVCQIVNSYNWKYKSLSNPQSLKYTDMYILIGLKENLAYYYQSHLSQFSHGLFFSNVHNKEKEIFNKVLYESIPIEEKMVKAIINIFPRYNLLNCFICSDHCTNLIKSPDFDIDNLSDFTIELIRNKKELII